MTKSMTKVKNDKTKFVRVQEVAEMLNCSEASAYRVMREINKGLKEQGKIVIRGRVALKYILERI